MEKLTKYLTDACAFRYHLALPITDKQIRKMSETVDHQAIHDLLVEIARKAGDMVAGAQPHINTSGHKKNCTTSTIPYHLTSYS